MNALDTLVKLSGQMELEHAEESRASSLPNDGSARASKTCMLYSKRKARRVRSASSTPERQTSSFVEDTAHICL